MKKRFNPFSFNQSKELSEYFAKEGIALIFSGKKTQEEIANAILSFQPNKAVFEEAVRTLFVFGSVYNRENLLNVAVDLGIFEQIKRSQNCFAFMLSRANQGAPDITKQLLNGMAQTITRDELLSTPYLVFSDRVGEKEGENQEKKIDLYVDAARSAGCSDNEILDSIALATFEYGDIDFLIKHSNLLDLKLPDASIKNNLFGLMVSNSEFKPTSDAPRFIKRSAEEYIASVDLKNLAANSQISNKLSELAPEAIINRISCLSNKNLLSYVSSRLVSAFISSNAIESNPQIKQEVNDLSERLVSVNNSLDCNFILPKNFNISASSYLFIQNEIKQSGWSASLNEKIDYSASSRIEEIENLRSSGFVDNRLLLKGLAESDIGRRFSVIYREISNKEPENFPLTERQEQMEFICALWLQEIVSKREGIQVRSIPRKSVSELAKAAKLITLCMDNKKLINITNKDKKVVAYLAEKNCLDQEYLKLLSLKDRRKKLENDFGL